MHVKYKMKMNTKPWGRTYQTWGRIDQTWGQIMNKIVGRFDQILGMNKPNTKGRIDRDGLIWEWIDWHPTESFISCSQSDGETLKGSELTFIILLNCLDVA